MEAAVDTDRKDLFVDCSCPISQTANDAQPTIVVLMLLQAIVGAVLE